MKALILIVLLAFTVCIDLGDGALSCCDDEGNCSIVIITR